MVIGRSREKEENFVRQSLFDLIMIAPSSAIKSTPGLITIAGTPARRLETRKARSQTSITRSSSILGAPRRIAIAAICVLRGAISTARSPTTTAPSNWTRAWRRATTIGRTRATRRAITTPRSPIMTGRSRDELYIVARGDGVFFDGASRRRFQTGDLIFVPAGIEHRFEDFTDDFAVWVIFYGPEGGEKNIR